MPVIPMLSVLHRVPHRSLIQIIMLSLMVFFVMSSLKIIMKSTLMVIASIVCYPSLRRNTFIC